MKPAREPNQFEAAGRRAKVARLLHVADQVIALMPPGTDDVEAAQRFRRFRVEDRNRVALLAAAVTGKPVRTPSDETWRAFCEAVATRKALAALDDEPEAQTRPSGCDEDFGE